VAAFSPPVGGPGPGPSKDTLRTPLVRTRSGCAFQCVRICEGGSVAARPAGRSRGKQQGMGADSYAGHPAAGALSRSCIC